MQSNNAIVVNQTAVAAPHEFNDTAHPLAYPAPPRTPLLPASLNGTEQPYVAPTAANNTTVVPSTNGTTTSISINNNTGNITTINVNILPGTNTIIAG